MLKSLYRLRETPLSLTWAICTRSTPLAAWSIIGLYIPSAFGSATSASSSSGTFSAASVPATPEVPEISGVVISSASRGGSGSGGSGGTFGSVSLIVTVPFGA